MKNFAIAFLLLFASVQGAFDANLLKQELSKLDETTSSTIQALIEEGGPVQNIINLFLELRADILAEQDSHDARQREKELYCSNEISRINTEIDELNSRIHSKQGALSTLDGEIAEKEKQQQDNLALLDENNVEIERAHEDRKQEHEDFLETVSDHQDAIDAIDEVLRLLDESTLTAALEKANSLISSVKSNAHSSTIRMTVAMLETTLKSAQDQQPEERKEKVDRIITLLHQLREQFVNSLKILKSNEENNEVSYNNLIDSLNRARSELISASSSIAQDISNLNSQRSQTSSDLDSLTEEVEALKDVLAALIADCDEHAHQHEENTRRRNSEIETIDRCIEILGGIADVTPGICGQCSVDGHCEEQLCACNEGFRGNGFTCDEINPCAEGADNCDANAECIYTEPGKFSCECKEGFEGDGSVCVEINPCEHEEDDCDTNAVCTHTGPNQHECICKQGYSGTGQTCEEVNPCTEETDDCSDDATCQHTGPGTFSCSCNDGYSGDGKVCAPENNNHQEIDGYRATTVLGYTWVLPPYIQQGGQYPSLQQSCSKFGRSPANNIVVTSKKWQAEEIAEIAQGFGFSGIGKWTCCANSLWCNWQKKECGTHGLNDNGSVTQWNSALYNWNGTGDWMGVAICQ